MDTNQYTFGRFSSGRDVSHGEGHVTFSIKGFVIGDLPLAEIIGHFHSDYRLNQLLVAVPVFNEIFDGNHANLVMRCERLQFWQTGHGAVFIHDFAKNAIGWQSCQAGEIYYAFSMAGSNQDAAFAGAQGVDMARTGKV